MTNIDIEQTKDQARKLLNSRIDSITDLVKTRQRVADLKAQLVDAERDDKRAYARATKDGWSADELKKLGLDNTAPAKGRSNAPKRSTRGTNAGADQPADTTPSETA